MNLQMGAIKKVIKVSCIDKHFFAECLCYADGKEFFSVIPHESWPLHHLPKIIGMNIFFFKTRGDKYDLIPLNFQPFFISFEFLQRLINHGSEEFLEIIKKTKEDEEKFVSLNIEERLKISRREINLFNKYRKKKIDDTIDDLDDPDDIEEIDK